MEIWCFFLSLAPKDLEIQNDGHPEDTDLSLCAPLFPIYQLQRIMLMSFIITNFFAKLFKRQ